MGHQVRWLVTTALYSFSAPAPSRCSVVVLCDRTNVRRPTLSELPTRSALHSSCVGHERCPGPLRCRPMLIRTLVSFLILGILGVLFLRRSGRGATTARGTCSHDYQSAPFPLTYPCWRISITPATWRITSTDRSNAYGARRGRANGPWKWSSRIRDAHVRDRGCRSALSRAAGCSALSIPSVHTEAT